MPMKITFTLVTAILFLLVSCSPSDEQINQSVQKVLASNTSLSPVSASAKDGVVTLTGEVESETLRTLAETSVSGVNGVKSVVNSVTVKPPGPTPEELKKMADDALLQKVNANFATYKVTGVTATVADSIVTLTGQIKRSQLQNAMKAAMESGATKVENKLTIK
jgi:hyperosmotically inducible periplasmic protein